MLLVVTATENGAAAMLATPKKEGRGASTMAVFRVSRTRPRAGAGLGLWILLYGIFRAAAMRFFRDEGDAVVIPEPHLDGGRALSAKPCRFPQILLRCPVCPVSSSSFGVGRVEATAIVF